MELHLHCSGGLRPQRASKQVLPRTPAGKHAARVDHLASAAAATAVARGGQSDFRLHSGGGVGPAPKSCAATVGVAWLLASERVVSAACSAASSQRSLCRSTLGRRGAGRGCAWVPEAVDAGQPSEWWAVRLTPLLPRQTCRHASSAALRLSTGVTTHSLARSSPHIR